MNKEEQILEEIKELGDEVRVALGKMPAPSRHKQTVSAWNRITEATELIDNELIPKLRPGTEMASFVDSVRRKVIITWLEKIRKTLVGGK